jgi:hypothetical protein
MIYTTGWARIKTAEQYAAWLSGLNSQDKVLFQEFVPRGNSCLDLQLEGWRFTLGRAILVFGGWSFVSDIGGGSDTQLCEGGAIAAGGGPWGDVFQARIVPVHYDVASRMEHSSVVGHAPVYEPEWAGFSRCLVFSPYGSGHGQFSRKLDGLRFYDRRVDDGTLLTIFGDADQIRPAVEEAGLRWLYSEDLG